MVNLRSLGKLLIVGVIALAVAIVVGVFVSREFGYNLLLSISTVFTAEIVLVGIAGLVLSGGTEEDAGPGREFDPPTPDADTDDSTETDDGFTPGVTDDEVRAVLRDTDEDSPRTTEEVANEIGCRVEDAYQKLELLRGYGLVRRNRVDEDTVEWWGGQSIQRSSSTGGDSDRDLRDEADQVRQGRLDAILAGDGPRGFDMQSNVVLHVIPKVALDDGQVDIDAIPDLPKNVTMGRTAYTARDYNTDGRVFSWEPEGEPITYVQFFRNGLIESVDSFMLEANDQKTEDVIPSQKFERQLVNIVRSYLDILKDELEVDTPVFVALSLTGASGYGMALGVGPGARSKGRNEFTDDLIKAPVVRVDDFQKPTVEIMREPLRYVWNAAGFKDSVYFDEEGDWKFS